MKKKIIWGIAIIIIIILIGFAVMVVRNSRTPEVAADCAKNVPTIITYTAQKQFSPDCIEVNSGATVTYVNQSEGLLQLATNPHPIHTGNKEVSDNKFVMEIGPGTSGETTVSKKGTFGYHDHGNASAVGVIVVK